MPLWQVHMFCEKLTEEFSKNDEDDPDQPTSGRVEYQDDLSELGLEVQTI